MKNNNYDEKQVIDRGKAFQYGFFAAMVTMLIAFFAVDVIGIEISTYALFLVCFWIPLLICFLTLIIKDAYDGVNSTSGRIVISIIGLDGLVLIVSTIIHILTGKEALIYNGKITEASAHIFDGIAMTTICITYWVKQFLNKRKYIEK